MALAISGSPPVLIGLLAPRFRLARAFLLAGTAFVKAEVLVLVLLAVAVAVVVVAVAVAVAVVAVAVAVVAVAVAVAAVAVVASSRMGRTMVLNQKRKGSYSSSCQEWLQVAAAAAVAAAACALLSQAWQRAAAGPAGAARGVQSVLHRTYRVKAAKTSVADGRRMEKVTKGKVLSNLDQVFFDLPAAAGTPPGQSSGSQPYWGGVKNARTWRLKPA